jgi:hypothetical protein
MKNVPFTSHSIPVLKIFTVKSCLRDYSTNPQQLQQLLSGDFRLRCSWKQLDPLDKLGLAYYTPAWIMRGQKQADFQTIFDRLESAGASLGFGASVHNTVLAAAL